MKERIKGNERKNKMKWKNRVKGNEKKEIEMKYNHRKMKIVQKNINILLKYS